MFVISISFYIIWLSIYPQSIQKFWVHGALSGIVLWKIPIEEIVWFVSAGTTFGIFYEFWLNVNEYPKLKKKK